MRLSSTLSIAASGVQVASIQVRATAHNTANGLTDGYRPVRAQAREAAEGVYVVLQTQPEAGKLPDLESPVPRTQTDAVQETLQHSLAVASYRANLKVLQSADELAGVVISLRDQTPGDSRDNRG